MLLLKKLSLFLFLVSCILHADVFNFQEQVYLNPNQAPEDVTEIHFTPRQKFKVIKVLGSGDNGTVFLCTNSKGKKVAVKLLKREDRLWTFEQELVGHEKIKRAKVAQSKILKVFYADDKQEQAAAFVKEYIEGPTLGDLVRMKKFTVKQQIEFAAFLVDASRANITIDFLNLENLIYQKDGFVIIDSMQHGISSELGSVLDRFRTGIIGIADPDDKDWAKKVATRVELEASKHSGTSQFDIEDQRKRAACHWHACKAGLMNGAW